MKKLLLVAACTVASLAALAQGTVNFNNSPSAIGGAGAPISDIDGVTKLAGTTFMAVLYAGPSAGALAPIGATLTFRTGAGAGFFNTTGQDTSRIIGTVAPGAVATIQVRAWENTSGAITSWDLATAAGVKTGQSAIFTVTTGGVGSPPSLPANLVGLTSFSLVPEPATYALLALGAGALLLRRRK